MHWWWSYSWFTSVLDCWNPGNTVSSMICSKLIQLPIHALHFFQSLSCTLCSCYKKPNPSHRKYFSSFWRISALSATKPAVGLHGQCPSPTTVLTTHINVFAVTVTALQAIYNFYIIATCIILTGKQKRISLSAPEPFASPRRNARRENWQAEKFSLGVNICERFGQLLPFGLETTCQK